MTYVCSQVPKSWNSLFIKESTLKGTHSNKRHNSIFIILWQLEVKDALNTTHKYDDDRIKIFLQLTNTWKNKIAWECFRTTQIWPQYDRLRNIKL